MLKSCFQTAPESPGHTRGTHFQSMCSFSLIWHKPNIVFCIPLWKSCPWNPPPCQPWGGKQKHSHLSWFLLKRKSGGENNAHTKKEGWKGSESGLPENIYFQIWTQRNLKHSLPVQWICCCRLFKVEICHIYPPAMSVLVTPPGPWQHNITLQDMPSCERRLPHLILERKFMPKSLSREMTEIANDLEARMAEAGSLSLLAPSEAFVLVCRTFGKSPSFVSQLSLLIPIHKL